MVFWYPATPLSTEKTSRTPSLANLRLSRYRNLSIVSNDLENGESVFLGHRSTHGHRDIHFYRNLLPFSLLTNTYPVLQLALQFPNIQLLTLRDRRDPPPLRHHRADIHLSLRTQSISPHRRTTSKERADFQSQISKTQAASPPFEETLKTTS